MVIIFFFKSVTQNIFAEIFVREFPKKYVEKSKSLGSGGSMVARLKLKEIDGRAPPGVEVEACQKGP